MPAATANERGAAGPTATMTVQLPDGRRIAHRLSEGDSVVLGASAACELQIEAEDVASLHCMVGLENGALWVRDCFSPSGTMVNGRRITEAQFRESIEMRVGSCHVSAVLPETAARAAQAPEASGCDAAEDASGSGAPVRDSTAANRVAPTPETGPDHCREADAQAPAADTKEPKQPERCSAPPARDAARRPRSQPDPFQEEMVELLRDEVAQLQAEVAERDARLAELADLGQGAERDAGADDAEETPDTVALVERLEQLLEELQYKDEQVELVENLLRAEEEANRAEQEERRQLEAWVTDIEERIGQREAEWNAAQEKLLRQIDAVTEERNRAEQALDEAVSGDLSGIVEDLRRQLNEVREALEESERQRAELQRRGGASGQGEAEGPAGQEVDDTLREQQLEIARQQAELARQRAELESARNQLASASRYADSDDRIRALRQHLQQVHEQEKSQQLQQGRSLSTRIASLWKRLEGRGN